MYINIYTYIYTGSGNAPAVSGNPPAPARPASSLSGRLAAADPCAPPGAVEGRGPLANGCGALLEAENVGRRGTGATYIYMFIYIFTYVCIHVYIYTYS